MIRQCYKSDFDTIYEIINEAAQAYKGVISTDCWKEPYMSKNELRHEMEEGVIFWGYKENGELVGVMGIQHVQDVTLIRHAYVRTVKQNQGIGGSLLFFLRKQTNRPILIGTWVAANWAIGFQRREGSLTEKILVDPSTSDRKLDSFGRREVVRSTLVMLSQSKNYDHQSL